MRYTRAAALMLCALDLFAQADEPVAPPVGKLAAYGFVGFGGLAPDDIHDTLNDRERLLQTYGFPVEWNTFGGAFELGGGLMWRASRYFGVGVDGGFQIDEVRTDYSDRTGAMLSTMKLRVYDLSSHFEFWVPQLPGFHLGTSVGWGYGEFFNDMEYTDNTRPALSFEVHEEFTGSGLTYGVFTGMHVAYGTGGQVFLRGGYRFRNLGPFDSDFGEAVNGVGEPIDFDFSGFYARLGLGFNLF